MEAVLVLHLTLLISTARYFKNQGLNCFLCHLYKVGKFGKEKIQSMYHFFFCPLQVVFNSRSSAVKQMGT